MAESAFGVDHGEFSKAGFRMPGSFKPKMAAAGNNIRSGMAAGSVAAQGMAGKAKGAVGNMARPQKSTVAAGVGGGAAGAAGGTLLGRKQQKRPGQV